MDDDINHCKTICWWLKFKSYDSIYRTSGSDAIQALQEEYIDVAIIDVRLPDMDGLSVIKAARDNPICADLPVIMLSADSNMETIRPILDQKVEAYLLKPFDSRKLLAVMQEIEPKLRWRRDLAFVKHFMANYDRPTISNAEQRKLVVNLQKSSFFKVIIDNPVAVPAELRSRLAHTLHLFFQDLDRMMMEHLDPYNDEKAMETLKLVDEISGHQPLGTKLTSLVSSENVQIASKAVKILGKTTSDIHFLKRFLLNKNSRFVANLIESLWESTHPETIDVFRQFQQDGNPRIRANCIVGMYLKNDRDHALEKLFRMLDDTDPAHVRSALWACGHLHLSEALDAVGKLAAHPDPDVVHGAREVLVRLRMPYA